MYLTKLKRALVNSHSSFLSNTQADIMFIDKEYRWGLIILIKNRRKSMRVKIKVENEKLKFNMSEKQALLLVKMAKEFEKIYILADVFATLDDADSEMDGEAQKSK